MSEKEKRPILPVIVTDRVVDAERSEREWGLSEPLECLAIPCGFDGCDRPIYVVANNRSHMAALMSFGIALAYQAPVRDGDLELGLYEHAAVRAREARIKNAEAYKKIREDWESGKLTDELAGHLLKQLERSAGHCRNFSTNWVYASLIYAPLAINALRKYEDPIKTQFFGKNSSTANLDATDRKRARHYFRGICSQLDRNPADRPEDSRLVIPLTQRLIQTVLPKMLGVISLSETIDCADIEDVSRTSRRDTRIDEECLYEEIQ